ncbi:MAG: hypothetical protein FJ106_06750 [Deltaproteobacteria bacterium]|nr:hypothetical protein [Deltaproteobacteria bacterium]
MERELSRRLEVARVLQFLKDRESKEGGLSLTPDLYPDIEDTYFSIRILQLVNREVDRGKTGSYLKNIDWIHGYLRYSAIGRLEIL